MIKVVLIGRTYVGKSTLFNRLIGKRYAIEGRTPHTTRDARTVFLESGLELIDLPGLEPRWLQFHPEQEQWKTLLQNFVRTADIYLWVVDGQLGLLSEDMALFRYFGHRRWVGVVNKLDHENIESQWQQQKGIPRGQWFYVSASHKIGIESLKSWLRQQAPEPIPSLEMEGELPKLRVAVVGRPNVGKSSFCNQALSAQRVRVEAQAHTTRDVIEIPWPILDTHQVILMDTAGMLMRGRGQHHQVQTPEVSELQARRAIERCEVVFFMCDASRGISDADMKIYHHLRTSYASVVLLINKWDLKPADRVWKSQREARKELAGYFPDQQYVIFYSTKARFNQSMFQKLFTSIQQERGRPISTPQINDWVKTYMRDTSFKAAHEWIKIKYAVQKGVRPQRIYCFGNFSATFSAKTMDLVRKSLFRSFRDHFEIRYGPVFFSIRKLQSEKTK